MTGHYPATLFRTGRKEQQITARCSCGWERPAASHDHSNSQFSDHYFEATGQRPPTPTRAPRRSR